MFEPQILGGYGTILFARYAFSPNRLRFCGPDANLDIFEYTARNLSDKGLIKLLSEFEGAYPYLQFIAHENKIPDPFDWRVVEAYWLGNELLENIRLNKFYDHLVERFSQRIKPKAFEFLVEGIPRGAKPCHAFHVFDIFTRMGGIRGVDLGPMIETINNCQISWGKIIKIEKDNLEVEYQPIILNHEMLSWGPLEIKKIDYRFKGKSFLENPQIEDRIAFHWNWACDLLSKNQLKNLQKWTLWHLKLVNI